MMDMLKPYPEYKDSGLPWCPRIPSHWDLKPNRALVRQRKVLVGERHSKYTLLSLTKRGVIVRDLSGQKGKHSADMSTFQEVHPGDLVMCLFDVPETPRTIGRSDHFGMITGAYTVFEANDRITTKWLEAFYIAMDDRKLLSPLYSGLRNTIPKPKFLGIKTPYPTPDEQFRIVEIIGYLNKKVNSFILNRRRLIEVLNEQKQAIINRAVTRGLHSDVPLKSSGIDWLGDIPAHWYASRLKYLVRNVNEQTSIRQPDEVYVALEHVEGWTGRITLPIEDIEFDSQVKRFRENDVLFGKLRPYLAKVTRPNLKGICVGEFLVLRRKNDALLPEFLEQELRSKQFIDIINSATFGAKMPRADWNFIGNLVIVYPPTHGEQLEILSETGKQTDSLQAAIDKAKREINLIREYCTRLIYDVVTGKIDVRHLVLPADSKDIEEMAETRDPLEDAMADVEMDDKEDFNESD